MNNICHLAMTPVEFFAAGRLPEHIAWMACHFSPGNQGLSNLPGQLPPDSVLILNDSIPPAGHDPVIILTQLNYLIRELQVACVLLDFQRPENPETVKLTALLVEYLPFPVCVSPLYAINDCCPVFLPSPLPHQPLEAHIAPWAGREIWLELAPDAEKIAVTEAGSAFTPLPPEFSIELPFVDTELCCKYQTQIQEASVLFTLYRDRQMLQQLQQQAATLGISNCVSLYRHMH